MPESVAIIQTKLPFLLCGALGGYLLLMFTNPVRSSFRDGFRALRRYSALWLILGLLGFCYSVFQLAQRVYFSTAAAPTDRPAFLWARDAWRDPDYWLTGSPQSLWFLPQADFYGILREGLLPALENVAGIFNNLVTTFPASALAAVLLLVNWNGHHAVLIRALRKRFGNFAWGIHAAILTCAIAALAKPLIYVLPQLLKAQGASPSLDVIWFQWAPVVIWLSSLFEYLFGVCIQIYLILLSYVWVRGLTFNHHNLLDFAIRRFSYVVKWAALVMLLSTACIEAPLILKNFLTFADWFQGEELLSQRLKTARGALAIFLIFTSTLQITLTFHSESWRKAMIDHLRFFRTHAWSFSWYLAIAAIHFYALQVCDLAVRRGLGDGTSLWVCWILLFPWLAAVVSAWLLASWVCFFKRCDPRSGQQEGWMKF